MSENQIADPFPDSKWNPAARTAAWGLIAFGAIVRLWLFSRNYSLWMDEAMLALNIRGRSFAQLAKPLDYDQGAPIGFLFLTKLATSMFGNRDFALRLVPMFSSLLLLFIFMVLMRRLFSPWPGLIGLALVACSQTFADYAAQDKQYESDAAIAILLVFLTLMALHNRGAVWIGLLAAAGFCSIWLSHPCVFILAGAGLTALVFAHRHHDRRLLVGIAAAAGAWLVAFFCDWFFFLRSLAANPHLLAHWSTGFIPRPIFSVNAVHWFVRTFYIDCGFLIGSDTGRVLSAALASVILVGFLHLQQSRFVLFSLIGLPAFFTLCAAALKKYPFDGRLITFLMPLFGVLAAAGADAIHRALRPDATALRISLLSSFMLLPFLQALEMLGTSQEKEGIKPVLAFVHDHFQPHDALYVYHGAQPAFDFYTVNSAIPADSIIRGVESPSDWQRYADEVTSLPAGRVWLIFSHYKEWGDGDETLPIRLFASERGKLLDSRETTGTVAYLYELR